MTIDSLPKPSPDPIEPLATDTRLTTDDCDWIVQQSKQLRPLWDTIASSLNQAIEAANRIILLSEQAQKQLPNLVAKIEEHSTVADVYDKGAAWINDTLLPGIQKLLESKPEI